MKTKKNRILLLSVGTILLTSGILLTKTTDVSAEQKTVTVSNSEGESARLYSSLHDDIVNAPTYTKISNYDTALLLLDSEKVAETNGTFELTMDYDLSKLSALIGEDDFNIIIHLDNMRASSLENKPLASLNGVPIKSELRDGKLYVSGRLDSNTTTHKLRLNLLLSELSSDAYENLALSKSTPSVAIEVRTPTEEISRELTRYIKVITEDKEDEASGFVSALLRGGKDLAIELSQNYFVGKELDPIVYEEAVNDSTNSKESTVDKVIELEGVEKDLPLPSVQVNSPIQVGKDISLSLLKKGDKIPPIEYNVGEGFNPNYKWKIHLRDNSKKNGLSVTLKDTKNEYSVDKADRQVLYNSESSGENPFSVNFGYSDENKGEEIHSDLEWTFVIGVDE